MAQKPIIVRDFLAKNDAIIDSRAQHVFAALNGNANFPNPMPSLGDLAGLLQKFQQSVTNAQTRDHIKILLKNDLRTQLQSNLNQLADYVTLISNRNRAIMATAGYLLNNETQSDKPMSTFTKFTADQGKNSGEAIINFKAPNADFYIVYYTEAPAASTTDLTGWKHQPSKTQQTIIKNLKPAIVYSILVKAYGSNEQVIQSEVITKMFI